MSKGNSRKRVSEEEIQIDHEKTAGEVVGDSIVEQTHQIFEKAIQAYGVSLVNQYTARYEEELRTRCAILLEHYVSAAKNRFKYEIDGNILRIEINLE